MNADMKRERRDGLYLRGGVWWMSYTINGKRLRESTEYSDRKAASLVLAKVQVAVKEGKWFGKVKEVKTSFPAAIEDFLNLYSKQRKVSWTDDETVLKRFSKFLGPEVCLQDVDRLKVEQFQNHLLSKGLTKARVNRYTASLKCFFNRCIDWGKLKANPVKGIKLYAESMRVRYLEMGQIQALLEVCSPRMRPIVLTALLTGLRKSDIFKMRWQDIDFENRKINIHQSKTGNPITINMSKALAAMLKEIPQDVDCPYVFSFRGKQLNDFGWTRGDFLAATQAAGLTDFRFHDLRHTFATQQRFLGKDLTVVKELLGHKSIRMTMRYAHVKPVELEEAVDQLGEKIMEKVGQNQRSLVTFKSQSASEGPRENLTPSRNESISQSNELALKLQSNPIHQTVNLTGYALRRFESFPQHHFFPAF